jgi:hypothetical protein
MKWMWVVVLAAVIPCLGATPATTQSAGETSTPVGAAKQFALAFMNPTKEGLRASVGGRSALEEQAADLWAAELASQFRLQEVVKQKFGADGYAAFFGRPPHQRPAEADQAQMIEKIFADAKVEQAGERARITVSQGQAVQQMYLDRGKDGVWRAWIGAVLPARSEKLIRSFVESNGGAGKPQNRVSDEIEAGVYATPQAAKARLTQLEDEQIAAADPAATQPSSLQQGQAELRAKLEKAQELEAERDRLEREAATQPIGN